MKPWYFTLKSGRTVMILPHPEVKHDGHPIISYNYNVFKSEPHINMPDALTAAETKIPDTDHPDFLGYISFEQPGRQYSYNSQSEWALNRHEVAELIDQINYLRDNPHLWQINN
jgi:hypothetical protein